MGFYIRKSVNLGGVRLNLSKGGIGVSTGVKGFRVGMNGRGTYVHMGRGGLYYRQQLAWNRPTRSRPAPNRVSSDPRPGTHASSIFFTEDLAQPLDISSGLADVDHVLAHFHREAGLVWIPWLLGVLAVLALFGSMTVAVTLAIACLASIVLVHALRPQRVLVYDLEGDSCERFEALVNALEDYFLSSRLWLYEQRSATGDWKRNAGATSLVKRRTATAYTEGERLVRSNISIPTLASGGDRIHFLPDLVVCVNGAAISAFSYADLDFRAHLTRFIEDEPLASDAVVVDQTWQFANKNGGPDRRFNNNRMLPVCQYQEAQLSLGASYQRTLTKSRVIDPAVLYRAFDRMRAAPVKVTEVPIVGKALPAPQPAVSAPAPDGDVAAVATLADPSPSIVKASAMTAPFGIEFYTPLSNLKVVSDLGQKKFVVEPPSPHPLFLTYLVQTNAAGEVVWVKGISDEVGNDSFGVSTRTLVDRVAEQLSHRYGVGEKNDFFHHGGLWGDPQYWMNALEANERGYFHLWERPRSKSLPDDLATIYVGAIALDTHTANVALEYASSRLANAKLEDEREMANLL